MTRTGRFAPSPTGPLHMGSLLTALASYLDIKQRGGQWYVRIDDLDPPRQDPEASQAILAGLHAHGLVGDKPVDYQSQHQLRYAEYFQRLAAQVFYCRCTRKQLSGIAIYPGACRGQTQPLEDSAVRIRCEALMIAYNDGILGAQHLDSTQDFGDFIVRRRDGLWGYNFATAVDDGLDATDVLRGQDLAHVTPMQIYLMSKLNLQIPNYSHIPVLCYPDGTKLSKQTHAPPLDPQRATSNLKQAYAYLGLAPPQENYSVKQWLDWGLGNWHLDKIPAQLRFYMPDAD